MQVSRLGKSNSFGKKRLLPPSKTMFAWAIQQRAEAKDYIKTRAAGWTSLGPDREKIEAAAEAAALAIAAAEAAKGAPAVAQRHDAPGHSIFAPVPTRKMVAPPSHLVFRDKVVTRKPKRK